MPLQCDSCSTGWPLLLHKDNVRIQGSMNEETSSSDSIPADTLNLDFSAFKILRNKFLLSATQHLIFCQSNLNRLQQNFPLSPLQHHLRLNCTAGYPNSLARCLADGISWDFLASIPVWINSYNDIIHIPYGFGFYISYSFCFSRELWLIHHIIRFGEWEITDSQC